MKLNLKEITKTPEGRFVETFTTDDPQINSISFEYRGTDDDLTNFLKMLILDYARKKKLID